MTKKSPDQIQSVNAEKHAEITPLVPKTFPLKFLKLNF